MYFQLVDDVMFFYSGLYGSTMLMLQPCRSVVHKLTPLMCGIDCVLTLVGAKGKQWVSGTECVMHQFVMMLNDVV